MRWREGEGEVEGRVKVRWRGGEGASNQQMYCVVQLVQSVRLGGQKKSTSSDSTCTDSPPPPDKNNKTEKGAVRGVDQSYSLRK